MNFKQPDWSHVQQAFLDGAREARANPDAQEADFRRAADGYTKRVFEDVDPEGEKYLRELTVDKLVVTNKYEEFEQRLDALRWRLSGY
jgi:hypothetical protein